jgi:teichuronic acid biosynthesis glycosyltransferase TuaC
LENWGDSPPEVLELWNRSREEVPLWMNAADICVLTSISEGSPQFIKESLACNRPVIATDVGDISEVFQDVDNAIIVNFEAPSVQTAIRKLLPEGQSNGRSKMTHFDHLQTARKIIAVYKSLKQS